MHLKIRWQTYRYCKFFAVE